MINEVVNLLNFFHDKNQKNLDIFGNPTDGSYEEKIKNTILHELTYKLSFLIQQENKYCGISNLHFEWVDGYKIVSRSLTERNGYQYEIGKKEYFFNIPVLHNNSFHFYRNLTDCFSYEDLYNGNRLFKVNAFVLKDDNGNLVNYEYYFDYDPYGMPIEKTRKTLNGDKTCAAIILLYEEIDASEIYLKNIQEKFHFLKNINIIYEEIKDYSERDVDKYLITNFLYQFNFDKLFVNILVDELFQKNTFYIGLLRRIAMICYSEMSNELKQFYMIKLLYD